MTEYSGDDAESFSMRPSSRLASFSASGGSFASSIFSRRFLISEPSSVSSPSSLRMAESCCRSRYSRSAFCIWSRAWPWIFLPSSSTSTSRFRYCISLVQLVDDEVDLEDLLPLRQVQPDVRRDQIGELARVLDVERSRGKLLGHVRRERHHLLEQFGSPAHERVELDRWSRTCPAAA